MNKYKTFLLFPVFKNVPSKQFINFGGWTLFEKTLDRVRDKAFDSPIISTNIIYKNIRFIYM